MKICRQIEKWGTKGSRSRRGIESRNTQEAIMEWNIGSLNDFTAQAKLHYAKICPPETTITIAKVLG